MRSKTKRPDNEVGEGLKIYEKLQKQMFKTEDFIVNPYKGMEYRKSLSLPEAGFKNDSEKRQWALLPWRELGVVVDVLTHGCKKYSTNSWMHVPAAERRYFEAALRHITARRQGEINDPESKLPHLAHGICCLLFWLWFDNKNRRGHR